MFLQYLTSGFHSLLLVVSIHSKFRTFVNVSPIFDLVLFFRKRVKEYQIKYDYSHQYNIMIIIL